MELVWPDVPHLESYQAALRDGWSPDTGRPEASHDELRRIAADPRQFLASLVDYAGHGPPVLLPDGSSVPRLPGYKRWIWDGAFCGVMSVRWQPGTTALPPTCLGHIGYSVVPWKRGRAYATRALGLLLGDLEQLDLPFVEITTDPTNAASQRVIRANGGVLVEAFQKPASLGGSSGLRFRIALPQRVR